MNPRKVVDSNLILMNPSLIENLTVVLLLQTVRIQCLPAEIPHRVGVIHRSTKERTPQNVTVFLCTSVWKNGRCFIEITVILKLMTKCLEKCIAYIFRRETNINGEMENGWQRGKSIKRSQHKALKCCGAIKAFLCIFEHLDLTISRLMECFAFNLMNSMMGRAAKYW